MLRHLPVSLRGARFGVRCLSSPFRAFSNSTEEASDSEEGEPKIGADGIPWHDCNQIDEEVLVEQANIAKNMPSQKSIFDELFGEAQFKLYYDPLCAPSRAVYHLVKSQELHVTLEAVDVQAGQAKTPEFAKLNPNLQVPVLEDLKTNETIFESHAIMAHLCRKFFVRPRYPTSAWKRARVDQYLHWHHENVRKIMSPLVHHKLVEVDEAKVADGLEAAEAKLDFIEKHFLTRGGKPCDFIAGTKRYTIADLALYHETSAAKRALILNDGKNLQFHDWLRRMEEETRPQEWEFNEDADGVWGSFDKLVEDVIEGAADDRGPMNEKLATEPVKAPTAADE